MARSSKQIGWSQEANLYYELLKQLERLTAVMSNVTLEPGTTTTTTTPTPIDTLVSVGLSGISGDFDIPYNKCSFGCWINMANDAGFPRLFSFGQYPTASQAISIEGNALLFWYNGSPILTASIASYLGTWVWISVLGDTSGTVQLFVNGVLTTIGTATSPVSSMPDVLYIGSENAPGTYYDGLMAGIIFDNSNIDLTVVPTSPFTADPTSTLLLFGQGNTLIEQTTDLGIYSRIIAYSDLSYSTSSPYSPADGGSLKFGA